MSPGIRQALPTQSPNVTQARKQIAAWSARLALLMVSMAAAVLLLEIGLRVLGMHEPRLWEPDPAVGWRHIPGARCRFTSEGNGLVEINSLGHRDRERTLAKPGGVFRIAVLGDSMTEAAQVNLEQTYCALLEERLSESGAGRVEVLNFGVAGYSPIQELLVLQRDVWRYQPDLVVLALFLDNDVSGCHPDLSVSSQSGAPFANLVDGQLQFDFRRAAQSYHDYQVEPICSIRKYSAIYRRLRAGHWRSATPSRSSDDVPLRFCLYEPEPSARWEQAWQILEATVLEIEKETRNRGVPLIVVTIPAAQVATRQSWNALSLQYPGLQSRTWKLDGPDRRFSAFARRNGLHLVEPLEAVRQAGTDPPLYFGHVGHLTPRGHEVLAGVLAPVLHQQRERAW